MTETAVLCPWSGGAPLAARLYRAPGAQAVALHLHGGGFVAGGLDRGRTVARWLAQAGVEVLSLAYPLAPAHPFPQPVEAAYEGLQWLARQRAALGLGAGPLLIAGEEAGANLAAALALVARDRRGPALAGLVLVSPMLDPCAGSASQRAALHGGTLSCWAEGWRRFLSGLRDCEHPYAVPAAAHRLAGLPPSLLLTGAADAMQDEAGQFAQRLRAAGVAVEHAAVAEAPGWPQALMADLPLADPRLAARVGARLRPFVAARVLAFKTAR